MFTCKGESGYLVICSLAADSLNFGPYEITFFVVLTCLPFSMLTVCVSKFATSYGFIRDILEIAWEMRLVTR
jgi:hypothetical protein